MNGIEKSLGGSMQTPSAKSTPIAAQAKSEADAN